MMEKQPQILLSMQACLKAATSGPSRRHMMSGLVSIDSPCSEYSGNTTRSMVERLRRALPTMVTMRSVWRVRSALDATTGNCSCTSPMTTPLGDLLRPPSPFMSNSLGEVRCVACENKPVPKQTRFSRSVKDYFSGGARLAGSKQDHTHNQDEAPGDAPCVDRLAQDQHSEYRSHHHRHFARRRHEAQGRPHLDRAEDKDIGQRRQRADARREEPSALH